MWCRLWVEMPNDPKWRTIARASKQSIGNVVAVFIHMMTVASQSDDRGSIDGWIDEDIASALDVETEAVASIRQAMQGRVLEGSRLIGWEKRQPIREDGSAERGKKWRNEKKHEQNQRERNRTQPNATERNRTHENAQSRVESETETETETENTISNQRESALSARGDETPESGLTADSLSGEKAFFDLTPSRIDLAKAQGHGDLAWIEEQTVRFANHVRSAPPSPKAIDGVWLNWLRKGKAYDRQHAPKPPGGAAIRPVVEPAKRASFFGVTA